MAVRIPNPRGYAGTLEVVLPNDSAFGDHNIPPFHTIPPDSTHWKEVKVQDDRKIVVFYRPAHEAGYYEDHDLDQDAPKLFDRVNQGVGNHKGNHNSSVTD